jgi:signal peptidase I
MFSTLVFAAVLIVLLVASMGSWALLLRLGLRWSSLSDVVWRRIVLTSVVAAVLQVAMNLMILLPLPTSEGRFLMIALCEIGAAVVPCAVICAICKVPFAKALQAWLPTLLASGLTVSLCLLVIRPYAFESFTITTNAMAPTLLGPHCRGECPTCGLPTYSTPFDDRFTPSPLMICDKFHVTGAKDIAKDVYARDHILVAKYLSPQRWDVVVFRSNENPNSLYAKRIVGLPGEEIQIRDGSIWVDDKLMTPPDSIQGIEYLSKLPFSKSLWGTEDRPALLGRNEYFVLGDFSAQSYDSRSWERGVPGQNPFAIPKSSIHGVVTHTFWPMGRWRIHR